MAERDVIVSTTVEFEMAIAGRPAVTGVIEDRLNGGTRQIKQTIRAQRIPASEFMDAGQRGKGRAQGHVVYRFSVCGQIQKRHHLIDVAGGVVEYRRAIARSVFPAGDAKVLKKPIKIWEARYNVKVFPDLL